jgi:hypothetical protein
VSSIRLVGADRSTATSGDGIIATGTSGAVGGEDGAGDNRDKAGHGGRRDAVVEKQGPEGDGKGG